MKRGVLLAALTPLTSCGAYLAHNARDALIGMNVVDLQGCMGPGKATKLDDREVLLTYDYKADATAFGVGAFGFKLEVGPKGECQALIRVLRDGTVVGVNYAGTTASIAGPYGACAPLIKECLAHPDQTPLPRGYDAFDVLLPAKAETKPAT